MSSSQLKRNANSLLNEFNKIAKDARREVYSREHVLILDPKDPSLALFAQQIFDAQGIQPPARGRALVEMFIDFHIANKRRTWKISPKRRKANEPVRIRAPSFGSLRQWKTDVLPSFVHGSSYAAASSAQRKELRRGISGEGGVGLHLGHTGQSVVSNTAADQLIAKRRTSMDKASFIQQIQKIKSEVGISGATTLNVTRQGKISRVGRFELVYEDAEGNLGKSSYEKRLATEIRKFLSNVAMDPASRAIGQAALDVLKESLTQGRVTSAGKKTTTISDKSTTSVSVPVQKYMPDLKDSRKDSQNRPFDEKMIEFYLNSQMTANVQKHMGKPSLVNRTGRFAESAKVARVDFQKGAGVYTVNYTYMRYPYEVFETDSGSRLATPHRDPRRIITNAIRDSLKALQLKKLYLRRI